MVFPIVVFIRPFIIYYRHGYQMRPLPQPITVEVVWALWAVPAVVSFITLCRGRINASGVFLLLIMAFADLLGVMANGYWNSFLAMSLMLDVLIAALLLPTAYLLPYTGFLLAAYGILAHVLEGSWYQPPLSPGEPYRNPTVVTFAAAGMLFAEVALIGFLRSEVDYRLKAMKQLVETLEERVTERTTELTVANKQLQALNRMREEFVANISHELRTPLSSINVYHHLLTTRPEKQDAYIASLRRETKRLEGLIEDLLIVSRLDREQAALQLKSVDLGALVSEYVDDRAALAESRGLFLTLNPAQDLPAIECDPGLLGHVVSNLLTNALNYSNTGDRIVVSVRSRQMDDRQWVGFSVSDTGPGILPEEQEHIFERFFRGKVGRDARIPGTGLGLAIAKEVVDRHQGRMEVESEGVPGKGTTFTVWLPVVGAPG